MLRNAIEAPCQGQKKKITIECMALDEEVQLIVSDNGDGIPPDILEQMFTPFFTTKPQGSGVGLSLARQIAKLHKGTISAESRNGNTRMVVTLKNDQQQKG